MTIEEMMEAAIHFIRSDVQETTQHRMENVMSEVNLKTESLRNELTKTKKDLKGVKASLDTQRDDLMETIRDKKAYLELKIISFKDNKQNLIGTKQGTMEAKMEATRLEFQSQLEQVMARSERGRGTGACVNAAQPPKFDGTTSWAVFRRQFESVAEHNCSTRQEKSTYLITAMQGRATYVLHGIPRNAT
jgi:arsenate reductase-like glutaredoxin family protein